MRLLYKKKKKKKKLEEKKNNKKKKIKTEISFVFGKHRILKIVRFDSN